MGDVFSHLIVSCSNHLDIITQPTELLYNPLKTLQIISFDVACTGTLDRKVKRTNCFLCQGQDSVVSCSTLPNHLLRDPFPQLLPQLGLNLIHSQYIMPWYFPLISASDITRIPIHI